MWAPHGGRPSGDTSPTPQSAAASARAWLETSSTAAPSACSSLTDATSRRLSGSARAAPWASAGPASMNTASARRAEARTMPAPAASSGTTPTTALSRRPCAKPSTREAPPAVSLAAARTPARPGRPRASSGPSVNVPSDLISSRWSAANSACTMPVTAAASAPPTGTTSPTTMAQVVRTSASTTIVSMRSSRRRTRWSMTTAARPASTHPKAAAKPSLPISAAFGSPASATPAARRGFLDATRTPPNAPAAPRPIRSLYCSTYPRGSSLGRSGVTGFAAARRGSPHNCGSDRAQASRCITASPSCPVRTATSSTSPLTLCAAD